ncbi:polysaccharide deacetylase family protein [Marinilabilia salmonicolor]|uniref:Peptidoglycan/xylan/chitin deacetylase (PgdA/CDA1 family) n=1 Tax=Marinilabilia salmonicolor TaxID=989 RepID=A0A2T0XS22_9BACT|nr:polysaccharide deacetylase family protein [Marinilabilia salmonicolor]PRZ01672.1 peptidoglycan/xylan/chitin deacetylase (PgdA/CDA1 family) [Marinilabilia salmonicolor]RCW31612.1 peptidoglycan/xylan/chitin deacetylase (PgdA/CDA1 family) [Marinilabilia salmonicolor]
MSNRSSWIVRPPLWVRWLFPATLWRENTQKKRVYLTFDDGPVPGVTPWVIDQLKDSGAKATFFCIGDNVRKYPGVYEKLLRENFDVGAHGFAHRPGHKTGRNRYFKDIDRGLEYGGRVNWFRPPHGIIFPWWVSGIKKKGLQVVLWDVLSCDYDRSLSPAKVVDNVLSNVRPGSIIVFHDSLKAWPNLKEALPAVLNWLKANGYTTELLTSINQNKRKL